MTLTSTSYRAYTKKNAIDGFFNFHVFFVSFDYVQSSIAVVITSDFMLIHHNSHILK